MEMKGRGKFPYLIQQTRSPNRSGRVAATSGGTRYTSPGTYGVESGTADSTGTRGSAKGEGGQIEVPGTGTAALMGSIRFLSDVYWEGCTTKHTEAEHKCPARMT